MALNTLPPLDLSPEPDLHPLYPTTSYIAVLLSPDSGLDPAQKTELVNHCLMRACMFGDLSILQFLLSDHSAQTFLDLRLRDEDGLGLVSLTIHGFGAESDRDVEREECVRLLIAQGADMSPDNAGWTPLHHAALLSPPTLVSYLMTHGCSPFATTRRGLMPIDVVAAHSILPGRGDVALLLEEAMRSEGWTGGRMEQKRRMLEQRAFRRRQQKAIQDSIQKILGLSSNWWGPNSDLSEGAEEEEDDEDEEVDYTPDVDYSSMLVFSPSDLPQIFNSLVINYRPMLRDATPANTLYLLARFACLMCDHTWLEDLIFGATDAIEETIFARADDVTYLVFWLYNTAIWLHLLQCDSSINEACEMLDSFTQIEEVIKSVFVFVIRFVERHIDQLLDHAVLDYSTVAAELDSVQFESDWSIFRPFAAKGKKRTGPPNASSSSSSLRSAAPSSPPSPGRPLSPSQTQGSISSSTSRGFSSLRQTLTRGRAPSTTTPLSALFPDTQSSPSPADLTSFLTAVHTLLTLSDINPVFTIQLWSQVMYWTSCEVFNRIITRKKYLCRSRALQVGMNLAFLEDWLEKMHLPSGIHSHFAPARDLLHWLQCLSSISDFAELVSIIQSLKGLNPLQMRRAARDYKYEVVEDKMSDECIQYLTQLQKDWERHRVKLGVEAIRKEMSERDRDQDSIASSNEPSSAEGSASSIHLNEPLGGPKNVDLLFGSLEQQFSWEPPGAPLALGELLDSRQMLPLYFPSDPRKLTAVPPKPFPFAQNGDPWQRENGHDHPDAVQWKRSAWKSRNRRLREVGVEALQWIDGLGSAVRWTKSMDLNEGEADDEDSETHAERDREIQQSDNTVHTTQLTRKPSTRRGKLSVGVGGDTTPS